LPGFRDEPAEDETERAEETKGTGGSKPAAVPVEDPTISTADGSDILVRPAPLLSRETLAGLINGDNKTLGVAIIILIILLCGGILLVPSIWTLLF
jgi:hypothetical protein